MNHIGAMMVAAALLLPGIVASAANGEEKVGQVQQPLVNGQPVSPWWQEELGLLTISSGNTGCSGTLLTNDWAITAAHCLSPANVANPSSVTVTANWKTMQRRRAAQIVMFGNAPNWDPWDVALVRVDFRFVVGVDDESFYQNVWIDGPYTPNLLDTRVMVFGRGIYRFASGSGSGATPSQRDGQYRYGTALIRWADGGRYWYVGDNGLMVAGGDSGGASFVQEPSWRGNSWGDVVGSRPTLVGIHSLCKARCLPGQACSPSDPWTWVMATPECGDAPIQPIWNRVRQTILATRSPSLPMPPLGPNNPSGTFSDYRPCDPRVFVPAPDAPAARITGAWGDRGIWEQDRINVRIVESPSGSATFDVVVREGSPPNAIEVTAQHVRLLERPTSQYGGPIYALAPTTVPDPRRADAGKLNARITGRPVPPREPGGAPGGARPGEAVTSARVPARDVKLFANRFDRSLGLDLDRGIRLEIDILCNEQLSPRVYQVRYLRFRDSGERIVDVMLKGSQRLPR